MTLGEIIKAYREEHHMSMDDFAKASGMSKTYVWMLEKNKNTNGGKAIVPTMDYIQKAAKAMFVDFDDLLEMIRDTVNINNDNHVIARKSIRIPVLRRIEKGVPADESKDIVGYEVISDEMAYEGSYFALKIKGDSMEPSISNGSVVIVKQQDAANNGDIVVALVSDGTTICKRLFEIPGGNCMASINPKYAPAIFLDSEKEKHNLKIIGKVVEARTKY